MDVADLGTIVSVWAHPDDESYLAGGVMAMARDRGQRVVCVSATAGEHGTDDPIAWPPDRLGPARRAEASAAMKILGVDEHRWLGFEDGTLADLDPEEGIAAVGAVLDEVRPDAILTFAADGMTFHPDHITVHAWVAEAWRRSGRASSLLCACAEAEAMADFGEMLESWGVYMTDQRPLPVPASDLALDLTLSEPILARKLAALAAMPTQVGPELLASPEFRAVNRRESFVAPT